MTLRYFFKSVIKKNNKASWCSSIVWTVTATVLSSIPNWEYESFNVLISSLWSEFSFATQHAMSRKFYENRGKECLNTGFPLLKLLFAGYSLKLKKKFKSVQEYRRNSSRTYEQISD